MGREDPRVTVVIPTWNRRALLRDAVTSVLGQTMADLELIVADDGSTDDTAAMLAGVGDARIRHLALPHAGEPATPRNAGLTAARAPLVAFLDSDDLWDPDKLERQLAAMPAGAWSYTGYRVRRGGADGNDRPADPADGDDLLRALLEDRPVGAPISSVVAPTSLVRAVGGFDARTAFREDRALLFRLAARARGVPIPDVVVTVRDHAARSTRNRGDHWTAWAAAYASFLPVAPREVSWLVRRRLWRHLIRALPRGMGTSRWWRLAVGKT